MKKIFLDIRGMHCRSCEILIEEKLQQVKGLKAIKVNYKLKQAEFELNYPATIDQANAAVKEAGYEVGKEQKNWFSQNPADYKDLGIAFLILVALYIVGGKLDLANLSTGSVGSSSSLGVIFIVGLTAGISTCMALVGGLVLSISARHSEKHPEATPLQKFRPHLFFNLGRVLSFFFLGGLIGLLGKIFELSSPILGTLIIIVGLVMLILGIQLTNIFPKISSASFTLPAGLTKLLGGKKHEKEYSHTNSIVTGALTFFLPCGFTQAMQLYAMSTGRFWQGALIMGIFALGTTPGLLGVGGLTSIIKGAFARKFFKFTGLLVIALALFNINNGLNLAGWQKIPTITNKTTTTNDSNVIVENGIQVVRMDQVANGYKPNRFTIKNNMPVKWIINSKDTRTCATSLVAPTVDVRKFLLQGENIIEFTPKTTGDIYFSCLMGMYSGKFKVID